MPIISRFTLARGGLPCPGSRRRSSRHAPSRPSIGRALADALLRALRERAVVRVGKALLRGPLLVRHAARAQRAARHHARASASRFCTPRARLRRRSTKAPARRRDARGDRRAGRHAPFARARARARRGARRARRRRRRRRRTPGARVRASPGSPPRTAAGRVACVPAVLATGAARTDAVTIALVEATRSLTTPSSRPAPRPRGSTASRLCVSVCGRARSRREVFRVAGFIRSRRMPGSVTAARDESRGALCAFSMHAIICFKWHPFADGGRSRARPPRTRALVGLAASPHVPPCPPRASRLGSPPGLSPAAFRPVRPRVSTQCLDPIRVGRRRVGRARLGDGAHSAALRSRRRAAARAGTRRAPARARVYARTGATTVETRASRVKHHARVVVVVHREGQPRPPARRVGRVAHFFRSSRRSLRVATETAASVISTRSALALATAGSFTVTVTFAGQGRR